MLLLRPDNKSQIHIRLKKNLTLNDKAEKKIKQKLW